MPNPLRDPVSVEDCRGVAARGGGEGGVSAIASAAPYLLVDGFHRVFEARARGYTGLVAAFIVPCDRGLAADGGEGKSDVLLAGLL